MSPSLWYNTNISFRVKEYTKHLHKQAELCDSFTQMTQQFSWLRRRLSENISIYELVEELRTSIKHLVVLKLTSTLSFYFPSFSHVTFLSLMGLFVSFFVHSLPLWPAGSRATSARTPSFTPSEGVIVHDEWQSELAHHPAVHNTTHKLF